MKKQILLGLGLLLINAGYSQVDFGIKGGLNLATVRYINTENSKARAGWNAGVIVKIPVDEKIFVRPELQYSSKGFAYSATATGQKGSLRLNYITLPVLFGYSLSPAFDLMAGPEFGSLRKAVSVSQGMSDDNTNFYRHFDVGFDLGAAYNFSKAFGGEVRYNYGFKDLVNVVYLNTNGDVISQGKNGANSVLQVGLYYWLSR